MRFIQKTAPVLLPLSAFFLLSGCSLIQKVPGGEKVVGEEGYLRDRRGEYLESESIEPMKLPDGVNNYVLDELYVIPDVEGQANYYEVPPRPRQLVGSSDREVVIQSIGDDSWIIVGRSPSQVWPRITDYWTRSGVPMTLENPTSGIMETGWFQLEQQPGERQKIRVFVEPGFQDNSAEIRLLNFALPQDASQEAMEDFPEESTYPEVEEEFLRDLSNFLAGVSGTYQASTVSLLAGNISSEGKADVVTENGQTVLRLEEDFERSWGAVGLALERAEIEVLSQDREQRRYELRFVPGESGEEPGFFGRIFSFGGSDDSYRMELRLDPSEDGESVDVRAESLPEEGQEAGEESTETGPSEQLLELIRNYIA